ncbi:hypothetical protein LMH87_010291 [Akanthomyces muscarius]|uniref:Uncharacterized protein n=1 Tax=Akanthomyces muscarius TaxID=2231603 RepID=A0A9W8UMT3_AKAMU|nr:hypothetical protein LMH87_010291 [Akanthomyces muscarius]KAJ4153820.1 hypothetical protein LMH87_010291 [Akanthomyces muscarius]
MAPIWPLLPSALPPHAASCIYWPDTQDSRCQVFTASTNSDENDSQAEFRSTLYECSTAVAGATAPLPSSCHIQVLSLMKPRPLSDISLFSSTLRTFT